MHKRERWSRNAADCISGEKNHFISSKQIIRRGERTHENMFNVLKFMINHRLIKRHNLLYTCQRLHRFIEAFGGDKSDNFRYQMREECL